MKRPQSYYNKYIYKLTFKPMQQMGDEEKNEISQKKGFLKNILLFVEEFQVPWIQLTKRITKLYFLAPFLVASTEEGDYLERTRGVKALKSAIFYQ